MRMFSFIFLSLVLTPLLVSAQSQGPAVGAWKSMNCYYGATSAAAGMDRIFVGTTTGMFVYDEEDEMIIPVSKVNGLSDVGIRKIAFDRASESVVIGYESGNIDIYNEGKITNVPDVMISTLPGDKTFRHITAAGREAYFSTPIGIIVVSLTKAEVSYTTTFFSGSSKAEVFATAIMGDYLYAATSFGLMRIASNSTLKQDYTRWENVAPQVFHALAVDGSTLYGLKNFQPSPSTYADSVFKRNASGDFDFFYTSSRNIAQIAHGRNAGIWIGEEYQTSAGNVSFYNPSGVLQRSLVAYFPGDIIERPGNIVYFTDNDLTKTNGGLRKASGSTTTTIGIAPDGPESPYSFDVWAHNGEAWIAHGGHDINWAFTGHIKAFSSFKNNQWRSYAEAVNGLGFDFLSDASVIFKDRASGKVYVAMAMGGLITVDKEDQIEVLQDPFFGTYGLAYIVSGIAQDRKGNIWFSNFGATDYLRMLQPSANEWHSFRPGSTPSMLAHSLIVDDNGYKWMCKTAGGGVEVFDDGGTFDNPADDRARTLRAGNGNGNLPSSVVYSIAKDLDNAIWIGTNDGIGIVERSEQTLQGTAEATIRIVAHGNEPAGALFKGKSITAIAVDGSNKKWVGTAGNGLWLISADGTEVVKYFQARNSPLPSDYINSIDIDPITGDVYISTDRGIVIYRGDATASYEQVEDAPLYIYPNPVPSGFSGSIAIRGLSGRSEIRITDIAGQLVAQWTAEGGQAVWNGLDYTGRRPQTGVYLVMVTNMQTGATVQSGKIIFNE